MMVLYGLDDRRVVHVRVGDFIKHMAAIRIMLISQRIIYAMAARTHVRGSEDKKLTDTPL